MSIAGKTFTGREIREKLGLQSTDFSWKRKGDTIIVSTKGYGHGVGMSQYGANGMAKEGKNMRKLSATIIKEFPFQMPTATLIKSWQAVNNEPAST